MKKSLFIWIVLIFFAFTSFAQRTYSNQNLEQVSQENLNFLIKMAQKQKKTGLIITATGSAAFITGLILQSTEDTHHFGKTYPSELFIGTGLWTMAVGVPFLIVGSSRVKKIRKIQNGKSTTLDGHIMEIVPCSFHNYISQNNQTGVTLRITF